VPFLERLTHDLGFDLQCDRPRASRPSLVLKTLDAMSLSGPPPDPTDHGTFREYRFDLPFAAAAVNPGPEVEGLSVIGRNSEWKLLRTRTASLTITLDL